MGERWGAVGEGCLKEGMGSVSSSCGGSKGGRWSEGKAARSWETL